MPKLVSQYRYDPLDRLVDINTLRRFYCGKRIASEIEGDVTRQFFESNAQPLALRQGPYASSVLVATDLQSSVLQGVSPQGHQPKSYSPYGCHCATGGLKSALGFNGERPERLTGHYLLGQGYRAYNPVLMRFNSPDSWSPFEAGGINAYTYCTDPVNHGDPSGHFIKAFLRKLKLIAPSEIKTNRLISALNSKTVKFGPALKHYGIADDKVPTSLSNLKGEHLLIKLASTQREYNRALRSIKIEQDFLDSRNIKALNTPDHSTGVKLYEFPKNGDKSAIVNSAYARLKNSLRWVQDYHKVSSVYLQERLVREGRVSLLPNKNVPYWDRYFGTNPRRGS
ncbi:hypothetical protein AQS70_21445 [Pseudomonas endophytica]|uniref:RHS repeat-associated core domain-containing protein n=1 Tax=Pseudomonas endophytica TaxID=1563157 RepID=A0A0Q0T4M0_9PSED|nr:RHS repeat-associated core domain-containing protein [Pseudomonas endophytica]KQB54590.1 hypothetical protein AQS70_21445 [Pseudomonas endophytica]